VTQSNIAGRLEVKSGEQEGESMARVHFD